MSAALCVACWNAEKLIAHVQWNRSRIFSLHHFCWLISARNPRNTHKTMALPLENKVNKAWHGMARQGKTATPNEKLYKLHDSEARTHTHQPTHTACVNTGRLSDILPNQGYKDKTALYTILLKKNITCLQKWKIEQKQMNWKKNRTERERERKKIQIKITGNYIFLITCLSFRWNITKNHPRQGI